MQYKTKTLVLAEKIGVGAVAKELGLHESQLYGWRSKALQQQDTGVRKQQLAAEVIRLKRQLVVPTN